MKLINIVSFSKKKAMYKYIDLPYKHTTCIPRWGIFLNIFLRNIFKLIEEYFEIPFSGEGLLLNLIMDIHCSAAEGGAGQNRMAVDMRGRVVKIFHFAEVINEWTLNGRIIETRVRISSFWFGHCMYRSYLRLIIYRFQTYLLLLVCKLFYFMVSFWIQ